MNHLLAFTACSTVAALLLMRLLPELVSAPESEVEPVKLDQVVAEAPVEEAPEDALPLLLPPPPVPTVKRVTLAPAQTKISPEETPPPVVAAKVAELTPVVKQQVEALAATVEPAPEAVPTATLRPLSKPTKAQPDPTPRRDKAARSEVNFVVPDPVVEAEGRVLLRILEHGSGPEVEIAWPVSAIKRRALYRLFEACYGMEIALLDSAGRLYGSAGQAGRPWQPNLDRYSGFIRQPSGRLTPDEKGSVSRIRALHGGLRAASNVRLFLRRLDALLLGGLKALIGERYARASAIRAHYRRDGDSVLVEGIRLDGKPVLGQVDLSKAGRRCQSGAWS